MSFGQPTSSDGSPDSTDHGEDGDVQFEMDASGEHTAHQFNDSASSGSSNIAHRSHESLAEDEALSREEGRYKKFDYRKYTTHVRLYTLLFVNAFF